MASSVIPLFLFSFFLLNQPFARANLHKANNLLKSTLLNQLSTTQSQINPPPKFFFEVTKSIKLSKVKPCSHNVLRHDFAYTYGKSPVLANYTFPSHCTSQSFSKIVLEWKATSRGRQFDRIFGVWLGGVELLRSCTAEPIATGILWRVEKDVTRYSSLLTKNDTQTLAVYLGNLIDKTYTGIYHVDITFHFYPAEADLGYGHDLGNLVPGYGSNADLIFTLFEGICH
ncbi:peptide-N4-(N-acetyl-beta-glucosaminyl)asparagine amidase A-like [Carica papaya]|uniref:peptide-N4-(N-acetyl-beta- glucosaminyl)asparagine amidase A-like n=1 Tax=Carica papaya TaxID=3649 RepID=UPI000B8CEDB2|nr:peptide-N4-(N-acetyl-beta-glucosaminyl)asparagine amidase A-like [Carica papaya]